MEAARRVGSWRATGRGTRSAGSARWRPGSWRTASTAPEPERPHHRRRRKRRHERREDMEDGEISEDRRRESRRSRYNDDYDQSGAPASSSTQFPGSGPPGLGVPPPRLPFIDTSRPPPVPVAAALPVTHPPPILQPPPARPGPFYPPPVSSYPGPGYSGGPHPAPDMYNAYSSPQKPYHGPAAVKPEPHPVKTYYDSLPAQPRPSDHVEAIDSDDEDFGIDITKVSPIMKYISSKLVEHKYHLEMDGPFRYRSDTPGLSKHLFVAYKIVLMLEGAGYDNSKMYMSAMFPQGMADTKAKLIKMMSSGELDARIKGSRLVKMCLRCIKCFIAYYTGKSDDIASSEGECDSLDEAEVEEPERRKPRAKTVNTSLTAILNRIKDEGDNDSTPEPQPQADPLSSVLNTADASR